MKEKVFNYINLLGIPKQLVVRTLDGIKFTWVRWEMVHGEHNGSGEATADELQEFLNSYGFNFRKEMGL